MNIHQAVVFAILMEGNNGILGKSPSYIWEKFELCGLDPIPERLLDPYNLAKFTQWRERWE